MHWSSIYLMKIGRELLLFSLQENGDVRELSPVAPSFCRWLWASWFLLSIRPIDFFLIRDRKNVSFCLINTRKEHQYLIQFYIYILSAVSSYFGNVYTLCDDFCFFCVWYGAFKAVILYMSACCFHGKNIQISKKNRIGTIK